MISVVRYNESFKEIWNSFVINSKNSTFLINRNYMDYHSDRFTDNSLMFYKDNQLISLLPANLSDSTLYSHQGLTYGGMVVNSIINISTMLEIFNSLIKFLKSQNIKQLIYKAIPHIYHSYPAEEDLYALFRNNAILFRRDIATVIDINKRIGFSKSKKCGLSKARQNNLSVKKSDDFGSFISIETEVLKRHKTKPVHSLKEIERLKDCFPNNIKLFSSYKDNNMVAGIIVFENKHMVHAQYIANSELGMSLGGLDIIVQYLLESEYKDKKYFDFGISTEQQGYHLNEGLIHQKEMFGGRAICYDQYKINIT